MNKKSKSQLRTLLNRPGKITIAPGAYDAFTARLIEQSGFEVIYMSGAGVSYSTLGQPDLGLVTMSEMLTRAAQIVSATNLPVIADADINANADRRLS